MEKTYRELDLRSLFHAIFRKAGYFIFSYIISAVLLASYLFIFMYLRPSYLSESIIYVSNTSFSSENQITVSEMSVMQDMTNTYLQIIKSNRLASRVVDSMNLNISATDFTEGTLSVSTIESTPFINISVNWDDPQTSYEINKAVLDNITDVLSEMNISGTLVVVDGPIYPQKVNILSIPVLAVIFVLAGLIIGFIGIILNELLYPGFRTESDVTESLGLCNCGVIPELHRNARGKGLWHEQKLADKAFLELFLNIRSAAKVFIINSTDNNEDKNYITVMLAKSASDCGKKVLIIEADGIYDEIGKYIPMFATKSLNGKTEFHVDSYGFDVKLTYQKFSSDSGDYIPKLEALSKSIDELEQKYDYIFVHNQPISLSDHACFLASKSSKSLFVISHNKTAVSSAVLTKHILESSGAEICGAVLSHVKSRGLYNYYSELRRGSDKQI